MKAMNGSRGASRQAYSLTHRQVHLGHEVSRQNVTAKVHRQFDKRTCRRGDQGDKYAHTDSELCKDGCTPTRMYPSPMSAHLCDIFFPCLFRAWQVSAGVTASCITPPAHALSGRQGNRPVKT
mmetsp:Transcript_24047/g.59450  ORF Transcript_24047/g.59450 Transcript_24047/m.59450 type:complete len:123 (-) Transcript_24047:610-978(-)